MRQSIGDHLIALFWEETVFYHLNSINKNGKQPLPEPKHFYNEAW